MILVSSEKIGDFSKLAFSQVKLGLKGYAGNKGAVAVRVEILGSSFCFINSHLAPHKQNFRLRNENIQNISRNLKFQLSDTSCSIFEHDHVFWFGDLNYRLDEIPTKKIIKYIALSDFNACLEHDQLNLARKFHNILSDFSEGEIDFSPTFKYLIGSNQHNVRRDPAWCDRVLWKGKANLLRYGSCDSIQVSDHKPVFACFGLELLKKDFSKLKQVKDNIYKEIDENHHLHMPKASISHEKILFEEARYKKKYSKNIEISNNGLSNFSYEIFSENWITCSPRIGSVFIGQSVQIQVNLQINFEFLQLFRASKSINNFLRIKIVHAGEFLIEIQCNVCDSFIGYPCEVLCNKFPSAENSNLALPLIRIIEYLKKTSLRVKNLFEKQVENEKISECIKKIDNNEEFDESIDGYTLAAVLLEFLNCLPRPLVEGEFIDNHIGMIYFIGFNLVKFKIFEKIPIHDLNFVKYLSDFMRQIIGNSMHNGATSGILAAIIFDAQYKNENLSSDQKKNRINFLEMLFYG